MLKKIAHNGIIFYSIYSQSLIHCLSYPFHIPQNRRSLLPFSSLSFAHLRFSSTTCSLFGFLQRVHPCPCILLHCIRVLPCHVPFSIYCRSPTDWIVCQKRGRGRGVRTILYNLQIISYCCPPLRRLIVLPPSPS